MWFDAVNPGVVQNVQVFKQHLLDTSSKYTRMVLKAATDPFLAEREGFGPCLAGRPELAIVDSSGVSFNGVAFSSLLILLIGVTANGDRSMYPFARLWAYMFLNSVWFGLVAFDDDRLALCMRDGPQQLLRAHITSREHAATLFKLGYLINLARNSINNKNAAVELEAQAQTLWKPVCGGVSRLNVLQHRFMELAKEMGVAKLREMATKVEFLDVSSLQGMVKLHSSSSHVVRAAWKGKQVVLKMRDLTLSDLWEEGLRKTIKEVDMYMRLHKLQGSCIPMLYSLGFLHGGMFAFLMMSDAGAGDVKLDFTCPPEAAIAATQGSKEALSSMHNRGILHGDLAFSNVVVSRRPSGRYVAMLVGFSQARLVDPGQQRHLLSKEWLLLERILKDLNKQQSGDEEVVYK